MKKAIVRKHSAKVLTITTERGVKQHYVLIGGRWFLNGMSTTSVPTKSKDGFWDDENIKDILEKRTGYRLSALSRIYKGCKTHVSIREWTTEQVVYGVPF